MLMHLLNHLMVVFIPNVQRQPKVQPKFLGVRVTWHDPDSQGFSVKVLKCCLIRRHWLSVSLYPRNP